jgi:hypothetical protein
VILEVKPAIVKVKHVKVMANMIQKVNMMFQINEYIIVGV